MSDSRFSKTKRRRMREKDRITILYDELASLRQRVADMEKEKHRSSSEMAESQTTGEQLLDHMHVERECHQSFKQPFEVLGNSAVGLQKPDQKCPNPSNSSFNAFDFINSVESKESQTDLDIQPEIDEKGNACMKAENSSLREMVDQLQQQLAEERKQKEESKAQLDAMKAQADIFKNNSTILAYQLLEMTVDRDNLLNTVEEKHEKIKEVRAMSRTRLRKMADQMEVKVYNEQVKRHRLYLEKKELQADFESLKTELEDQKLQLTVTNFVIGIIDDVDNEAKLNEAQMRNDEIEQLKDHVAKVESENRLYQDQEVAMRKKLQSLSDQCSLLKQGNISLEEKNRILSNEATMLGQEITKAHNKQLAEREAEQSAKTALLAQVGELKESCASLQVKNRDLIKDGDSLRMVVNAKDKEVASLKAVIDDLTKSVEEKENMIEQLQSRKRRGCFSRLICWR